MITKLSLLKQPRKGWAVSLDNIINIKNLSYTYMKGTPLEKRALDDITLDIGRGEFVALIGHTGVVFPGSFFADTLIHQS